MKPALVARNLESWFAANARALPWRERYDPYEVWISEVMLQQTRMEVVLPYFERFVAAFPNVTALADAKVDDVLAQWSGLGYYRRARMLHAGAKFVVEQFGGNLPATVERLRTIPGVGRYTSGAIASIAHDQPAPIVDGNVARLLARLAAFEEPLGSRKLAELEWRLAGDLVQAAASPRNFNQAMMELGARVCTPAAPLCGDCPLRSQCRAYALRRVSELPVPKARKTYRELSIPLFVVRSSDGKVLFIRERGKLMEGMLHLPHGNDLLLPGSAPALFRAGESLGGIRHTVTNRRIHFEVFAASLAADRIGDSAEMDIVWLTAGELGSHPHPSYVAKALKLLEK